MVEIMEGGSQKSYSSRSSSSISALDIPLAYKETLVFLSLQKAYCV